MPSWAVSLFGLSTVATVGARFASSVCAVTSGDDRSLGWNYVSFPLRLVLGIERDLAWIYGSPKTLPLHSYILRRCSGGALASLSALAARGGAVDLDVTILELTWVGCGAILIGCLLIRAGEGVEKSAVDLRNTVRNMRVSAVFIMCIGVLGPGTLSIVSLTLPACYLCGGYVVAVLRQLLMWIRRGRVVSLAFIAVCGCSLVRKLLRNFCG